MKFDLINIVHSLVIWQSLLFAVILVTPKYKERKENRFLAAFLLTLGLHFTYNLLRAQGLFLDTLPQYSCTYGFLYGPFLFLYIKFHFREEFKPTRLDYIHFIPFLMVLALTIFGFSVCETMMYFVVPVMLFYCGLSFLELSNYKKIARQIVSYISDKETKWIKMMLVSTLLILILNLVQMQLYQVELFGTKIPLEGIVQLGILILVNLFIYQGLRNPDYFQKIQWEHYQIIKAKSVTHTLNEKNNQANKELADKLRHYIRKNEPHLDPELDLITLAQSMDVHPSTLSHVINRVIGNSFSGYINSLRIEKAMQILQESKDEQLTMMEVMFDVGFNSRSVFNTLFKKKTGYTPSEYRKQFL